MKRFICFGAMLWGLMFPFSSLAEVTHFNTDICIPAKIVDADGRTRMFMSLEVAVSPDAVKQGLMHRTYLSRQGGMIFVFSPAEQTAMWMKNTLIPLDMIFVDSTSTVLNVHRSATPHDLTPIWSNGKAQYVIELKDGTIERYGLSPGQTLVLPDGLFKDL